jgi:hypothetical protein
MFGNFGAITGQMNAIDHKKRLFDHVVRLRRAQRDAPENRDIAAVRAALEEELGGTVSRRLAASLLGVTHPALLRWIKRGDLPVVYAENGREDVPVAALLELYDSVDRERSLGRRHVLEPTMSQGRERARRMRPRDLIPDGLPTNGGYGRADRRSLVYHRALARRLRRPMVDEARRLVWKWRDQGRIDPRYADQWEDVLRRPVSEVRRVIGEDSPRGRDLRQNSPFAGMLSEPERRRILEDVS